MRLHYLQHVPFEDLANITIWTKKKCYSVSTTLLFNNEKLPDINEFDWLIILGGPMNIYEEDKYPWLVKEKRFIAKAIDNQKIVLGICLGAQLIADVLGARVCQNKYKEIGWFPVSLTQEARKSPIFSSLPSNFIAFLWHEDTFGIPSGAIRIAETKACANQAFEYHRRVIGLQFHLEYSKKSISQLIKYCPDDLKESKYIQKPEKMLSQEEYLKEINKTMNLLLDTIERLS